MDLLRVEHICKTYGSGEAAVHALKDVSFSVPKGEFVAIVGESGSGKSTLLNMIGALDTPTSGRVYLGGKDTFSMKEKSLTVFRRRNIGFIFQAFNLIPELSVEQNIIFPLLLDRQRPNKRYLDELLHVLGLEQRRGHLPSQLSGGQQQRVAIARAIAADPEILFFDEPTSALDPELIGEVLEVMRNLAQEGMTMLVVTHEMNFAKNVSTKVIFMENGQVAEAGNSREFFENPRGERTREFLRLVNV